MRYCPVFTLSIFSVIKIFILKTYPWVSVWIKWICQQSIFVIYILYLFDWILINVFVYYYNFIIFIHNFVMTYVCMCLLSLHGKNLLLLIYCLGVRWRQWAPYLLMKFAFHFWNEVKFDAIWFDFSKYGAVCRVVLEKLLILITKKN